MTRLALVLSGGGARGAYEVGVLSYIYGDLLRRYPKLAKYELVSGTSVGAVNAAYMASVAHDPVGGVGGLEFLWRKLALEHVLGFGVRQAFGLHRVVLGGNNAQGIFDARPLGNLVRTGCSWRQIARNLRTRSLLALSVTTTHVATGRPVVFVDRTPTMGLPTGLPPQVLVRGEHILPQHVLASSAIPMIFPPVRIRDHLYCDGGLRLNTPMAPAIHMGANKLLVIGVSTPGGDRGSASVSPDRFPGAPFLLGKVLNAFLIDHIHADLSELERINDFLRDGMAVAGEDFLTRINERAVLRGQFPRRIVETIAIRPSVDIGKLAGEHLRTNRVRFGRALGRGFTRLLDLGEGADSDLASYLLFDGDYARRLIELGRKDAAARRDELLDFLERGD